MEILKEAISLLALLSLIAAILYHLYTKNNTHNTKYTEVTSTNQRYFICKECGGRMFFSWTCGYADENWECEDCKAVDGYPTTECVENPDGSKTFFTKEDNENE